MSSAQPRSLADIRIDYLRAELDESCVLPDPIAQARRWLDEAIEAQVAEPTAMTLATVDDDGQPHARVVLLKALDAAGLTFFTNYESDKGRELARHPRAAVVFFWQPLERQLRVEGIVTKIGDADSDAYFASRPRASQIGAWASRQSAEIASRAQLEREIAAVEARMPGTVARPATWGGYLLSPTRVELWQGRASRLHDRIRYDRAGDTWVRTRRSP